MTGRRKLVPRGAAARRAAAEQEGEGAGDAPTDMDVSTPEGQQPPPPAAQPIVDPPPPPPAAAAASSSSSSSAHVPPRSDSQRQLGTTLPASGGVGAPAGRLGSLKPSKFTPTIPTRRRKVEPVAVPEPAQDRWGRTEGERGRGRGRGRGARGRGRGAPELTASGPFALGPAARTIISVPGRSFAPEANLGRTEISHQRSASDKKVQEVDATFDPDDQWSPVSVGGAIHVKKELRLRELKVKREQVEAARTANAAKVKTKVKVQVKLEDGTLVDAEDDHIDDGETTTEMVDPELEALEAEVKELADLTDAMDGHSITFGHDDRSVYLQADNMQQESEPLLFFQFPSVLPKFDAPVVDLDDLEIIPIVQSGTGARAQRAKEAAKEAKIKAEKEAEEKRERDGPEGRVGQLVVYKNGKMKLKMGDLTFEVSKGPRPAFLQNIVSVDDKQGAAYILGNVAERYVCVPDVESLLREVNVPSPSR
ncbi:hypothetical protein HKX48_004559 [Thoreauomyces humboldtii]|nr:hypothetical protein HKX48_004559 [Thoreauomyces humboldtii]